MAGRFATPETTTGWPTTAAEIRYILENCFFPGITACAVNMVERIAVTDDAPVDFMEVSAEAFRDPDSVPSDLTLYADVRIHFKIWGVDDDQGNHLVDTWKKR